MRCQCRPCRLTIPRDNVDHTRRETRFLDEFAEEQGREGVCSAGFSTTVQPHAKAGA
jgi:hypothetical protein